MVKAQFIPYINGVVKLVDRSVEALNSRQRGYRFSCSGRVYNTCEAGIRSFKICEKGAQWLSENTPVNIDAELYFNLYTKGRVDLRRTIDFYLFRNTKTDVKISLLFRIELDLR